MPSGGGSADAGAAAVAEACTATTTTTAAAAAAAEGKGKAKLTLDELNRDCLASILQRLDVIDLSACCLVSCRPLCSFAVGLPERNGASGFRLTGNGVRVRACTCNPVTFAFAPGVYFAPAPVQGGASAPNTMRDVRLAHPPRETVRHCGQAAALFVPFAPLPAGSRARKRRKPRKPRPGQSPGGQCGCQCTQAAVCACARACVCTCVRTLDVIAVQPNHTRDR